MTSGRRCRSHVLLRSVQRLDGRDRHQALHRLGELPGDVIREVRGRGLWAGVEFVSLGGREACERLAAELPDAPRTCPGLPPSSLRSRLHQVPAGARVSPELSPAAATA